MTKAPKRLPLRCEPTTGESLSGFVHRLAERNGVRPSALLRILGERLPTYGNPRLLERLAVLADRDVTELAAMGTSRSTLMAAPDPDRYAHCADVFLGQIINGVQLRGRHRAVCPTCLTEQGYHRAWWELHFVGACPVHRCGLMALCPACNGALDWNTSSLTSCKCGQDMRRATVEIWHPIRLRATDYIAVRLAGRRPDDEPACLRELPLLHTIELLRFGDVAANWPIIVNLLAGSLVGAWFGAGWATRLRSENLYRVIAALLVVIAVVLITGHEAAAGHPLFTGVAQMVAGVVAGFAIGVVASLLGVAGGELLIPTLVLLFGADIKLAGSLSLAVSLPTMIVGFTRYSLDQSFAVLGRNRTFLLVMAVGSIVGTFIGGRLLGLVPDGVLLPALAIILLISSWKVWHHK